MATRDELRVEIDRARQERDRLDAEATQMAERVRVEPSDGLRERLRNLHEGVSQRERRLAELEGELGELESRAAWLEARAGQHDGDERVTDPGVAEKYAPKRNMALVDRRPELSRALDALDGEVKRSSDADFFADGSSGRVIEGHLRGGDPLGIDARYVAAVSAPEYRSAFGKYLARGERRMDQADLDPAEREAVARVREVEHLRAIQVGDAASGGYGVPIAIDPSIRLSSGGAFSPIRQLANVVQTSTREWRGVSSDGVTVQFGAELGTAVATTPTLAQPTCFAHRWHGFAPFSLEVEGDYPNLEGELLRLIGDARGSVESDKFLTGSGDNEPAGLLHASVGLGTAQRVQHAGTAWTSTGTAHCESWFKLFQAVPDRFWYSIPGSPEQTGIPGRKLTAVTAHRTSWDRAYKAVGTDSPAPPVLPQREGPLLGVSKYDWGSPFSSGTAAGQKVALAGSFSDAYIVTDRVGVSVEVIPQLFSGTAATYGAPIGARALFCWGRTGGTAILPNGLRYLELS